jgi:hypothetical protein
MQVRGLCKPYEVTLVRSGCCTFTPAVDRDVTVLRADCCRRSFIPGAPGFRVRPRNEHGERVDRPVKGSYTTENGDATALLSATNSNLRALTSVIVPAT